MTDANDKERESHEAIHRFVDGELDATGKAALAAKSKVDPMVRARALGVVEVRTLVQAAVEAQTPEIDSNELWAKIDAQLSDEKKTEKAEEKKPGLRVIPGGAPTPAKALPVADPAVRMRRIGATVIGAFALAAVAWLVLAPSEPTSSVATETHETLPAPPREVARTEVVEVDFGTNIGTVFSIEGDEGERYAVVWIDEGDPGDGALPEGTPD